LDISDGHLFHFVRVLVDIKEITPKIVRQFLLIKHSATWEASN